MNEVDELAEVIYKARWVDGIKDAEMVSDTGLAKALVADGYRKPPVIENDKLVIDDGMLLLELGRCTCSPYGSSHELFCGYEYLDDLTGPLERAGYRKPRIVTTTAEVDALPNLSVVMTCQGDAETIHRDNHDDSYHFLVHYGPATVLHEPEPK